MRIPRVLTKLFALAVAAAAGMMFSCISSGCAHSQSKDSRAGADNSAKAAGQVAMRVMSDPEFNMRVPAGLPPAKEKQEMIQTEGTADQLDPTFKSEKPIEVGINVYHSSESQFARRANVQEWAANPLPPYSMFRSKSLMQPVARSVKISGASAAALSISDHEGVEQLQTGGKRALSMRLYVKPAAADPGGWVIGAFAVGEANDPLLKPDSPLAKALQESLLSFELTGVVMPPAQLPVGHP